MKRVVGVGAKRQCHLAARLIRGNLFFQLASLAVVRARPTNRA